MGLHSQPPNLSHGILFREGVSAEGINGRRLVRARIDHVKGEWEE